MPSGAGLAPLGLVKMKYLVGKENYSILESLSFCLKVGKKGKREGRRDGRREGEGREGKGREGKEVSSF